jgi:hypothetical protein
MVDFIQQDLASASKMQQEVKFFSKGILCCYGAILGILWKAV